MPTKRPYQVQEFQDASCTYEIRAVFGDQIKLEEILSARALRNLHAEDMGKESPEKQEETI
ncbi:MAG: hypothetical protein LBG83_01195 [Oscillospiraceae bacterium]|jgi:hypothetical protein|nr:hypothetical protein [Oscillospiraceae bacterium]